MDEGKPNPGVRSSGPSASTAAGGAGERLESWKEIAAHLRRGVRTVQRWEREEGLPVHRHLHDKLGTVYAYREELDAWWNNRRPTLEAEEAERLRFFAALRMTRRAWVVVGVLVAVGAAAAVGLWLARRRALPFEERDWVLIASFENRTGEAVFDGTLEYALERELSNSRFVNVVPRERINDALQLMRKPTETKVDAAVGREVCLRDGGIRALITGRVEKLDTTYLLNASLVEPTRGVTVASFSEEAEGQKEVVPALRRLSHRLRASLGEELAQIQESDQKLEKVTTPSLRALQLFSHGSLLKEQEQYKPAEDLLRQAIAEDSQFASAYLWLAYAVANQRRPKEEYLPYAERALQLSKNVSEHERYFIRGGYHMLAREYEKAVGPLEALLRIYPDHYFGVGNLIEAYRELGRDSEAVPYAVRAADLRPNNFRFNAMAAEGLATSENDLAHAKHYATQARALLSDETVSRVPYYAAWLEVFPVREYMSRGEVKPALDELNAVAKRLEFPFENERARSIYGIFVGMCFYDLGKLQAAEASFQKIQFAPSRHAFMASVACARGEMRSVREHMEKVRSHPNPDSGETIMFARTGMLAEARRAVAGMETRKVAPRRILHARAEVALAENKLVEAASLYRAAIDAAKPNDIWTEVSSSQSLARIREEEGESEEAIALLEQVRGRRARAFLLNAGFDWMRAQMQLAQLYRRVGREEEARKVEAELMKLLAYADPDHPILRQLKHPQEAAAAQPAK